MRDFSYGQDILGNAVSKVMKIFQEEARITNTPAKQALNVILENIYKKTVRDIFCSKYKTLTSQTSF